MLHFFIFKRNIFKKDSNKLSEIKTENEKINTDSLIQTKIFFFYLALQFILKMLNFNELSLLNL